MPANRSTSIGSLSPADVEATRPTFAQPLRIADCTLRDGEQQAGVAFNRDEKVAIARALDELGVDEIEAGTPAVSPEDADAVARMVDDGLNARISVLSRAREDDIRSAAALGVWGVRLSLPISQIQRNAKMGLSDQEYVDLALRCSDLAKSLGLAVIFSPYDTTRADMDFLRRFLGALGEAGTVERVRMVDTAGCATPATARYMVEMMRQWGGLPVEVHCHDDLGLAVANTLSGAMAGAEHLSVTVNGLGERSGNASLEEVATALHVLYGQDCGLDLTLLKQLSELVEDYSGVRLHQHKSVVGDGAFSHESGMVVAGVLRDPFTAECYAPELVGQTRRIVLGKLSGLASIRSALERIGIDIDDAAQAAVLVRVKEEAVVTKKPITDSRLRELAELVLEERTSAPGEPA